MSSLYSASAAASFSRLGATIFATLSYDSMARTQQHSPYAAVDAFLITSGSNSGMATNLAICRTMAGSMLSLSNSCREARNPASPNSFCEGIQ